MDRNYQTGIVKGLILYTKVRYAAGQYDKAFKSITDAENEASGITDPVLLYNIQIMKGQCYESLGFYKEAAQAFNIARPLAESMPDPEERSYYSSIVYSNIGINFRNLDKIKERDYWSSKSYVAAEQLQKSTKYLWLFVLIASNRGSVATQNGKYDTAAFYMNKALFFAPKCSEKYRHKKYHALWVANYHAGNYYEALKQYARAASYYRIAETAAVKINYTSGLKKTYAALGKVYTTLGQTEAAVSYLQKSSLLGDSLAKADKAAIKTPLDYIIGKKQKSLVESQTRNRRMIVVIAVLIVMLAGAVFFYRQRLNREVRLREQKLAEMLQKLDLNADKHSPEALENLKQIIQLAVDNDPAFFVRYNEFDPRFTKRLLLLAPTLTAIELEFCIFCKLGFETKEIARYTNISVRAVEAKRYRVRKKLNIPSNQDVNVWMNLEG